MDNPVEFYKEHAVISGTGNIEIIVSDKQIPYQLISSTFTLISI